MIVTAQDHRPPVTRKVKLKKADDELLVAHAERLKDPDGNASTPEYVLEQVVKGYLDEVRRELQLAAEPKNGRKHSSRRSASA